MEDELLTAQQVADIVECEDLGYAIMHYMNGDDIADPKLRRAWKAARRAMERVVALLPEPWSEEDNEEGEEQAE